MTGKVFISCGQRPPVETLAAEQISRLLRDEFGLEPYVAFRVQSFEDTMAITKELQACDYYIFVDFKRDQKNPESLPCSLFTHQELALAHHLGFGDKIIALQQEGAPLEGFLRYVLSNPARFQTPDELLELVRKLVSDKRWNPSFSRNLVALGPLNRSGLVPYQDHTGVSLHESWRIRIENRRPDAAAVGAVCILDSIRGASGSSRECNDRSYLKWADQGGYERAILPQDYGWIDLCAVRRDHPGLFLLSSLGVIPRQPIVEDNGPYELMYKVYARDFPLLEFTVEVNLQWQGIVPISWVNQSDARLKLS